ncbi:MAG: hypothetical protein K2I76_03220 [Malacoplasma sp.]|nr:hypothetical protein [Malacoplasma sp.]
MKKFLKLGLCFLSLVPISLAVYSCSRRENDLYYDSSDKSTVKNISSSKFGMEFWDDLLIYDKNLEWNNEILNSNIQIDLRMFKHLQKIKTGVVEVFFTNIIDKWAKQFSTVGIDGFKGQIDYYFPDSFQDFYGGIIDLFYLPFQKNVYFGKATIKETLAFNMNNNDTECIFPESVEKIYGQGNSIWDHYYTNDKFLLTLRKIVFPSNFTVENIYANELFPADPSYPIFPFKKGYFIKDAIKYKGLSEKKIGDDTYYRYGKDNDKDGEIYDEKGDYDLYYFTEKEQELINNRLKSARPMDIQISKTFENNDEALKCVFGNDILDEEFELLKSWITYI